jgi:hypothetical protein
VELRLLSATSQKTVAASDILRGGELGAGTYSYSVFTRTLYDCGNVLYSPTDDAQDIGVSKLVAAKASRKHIDPEPMTMPFVADATLAAAIARLYFQRKLLKKSGEQFGVKATCIALEPGDFITIQGDNYGVEHDAIIDSMTIKKDCSIDLTCTGFSDTIENLEGSILAAGVYTDTLFDGVVTDTATPGAQTPALGA